MRGKAISLFGFGMAIIMLTSGLWNALADTVPINENLVQNESFEAAGSVGPAFWTAINQWADDEVAVSAEAARTGEAGVVIQTETLRRNPWAAQSFPVEPGAEYIYSAWYKSTDLRDQGVAIKLEFYSAEPLSAATYVGEYQGTHDRNQSGAWSKYERSVTAPKGAAFVKLYVRLYGTGKVMYDDVSFVKTKEGSSVDLATDQIFYYADKAKATVTAAIDLPEELYSERTIDFKVLRESDGQIAAAGFGIPAAKVVAYEFDPRSMALKDSYLVESVLRNAGGEAVGRNEATIYRWDRPTMLTDNGTILVDGKPFFPVFAYHVREEDYPKMREAGINTVQGWVTTSPERARRILDGAHANGLKVLFPLYYGGKIKENFETTRQFVTQFKDHPALLAWMMIDEPQNKFSLDEMAEAYRIIRSIDETHPVYLTEANPDYAERSGKVTDILAVDSYPFPLDPITKVGDDVRNAVQGVQEDKPIWPILQAFYFPGHSRWTYLPTIDELRNMAYQALIGGASALGYYSYSDPDWYLPESELYPGMLSFKSEYSLLESLSRTPKTEQHRQDGTEYAIWAMDGDWYVVVLNHARDMKTVNIRLPFHGHRGELLYGNERLRTGSFDDVLQVDIGPHMAYVYKLTSFAQAVQRAADIVSQAHGLSKQPIWMVKTEHILRTAGNIRDELAAAEPDMKKVTGDAAKAIRDLDLIEQWIDEQSLKLGEEKQRMLDAVAKARAHMENVTETIGQVGISVEGDRLYIGENATIMYTVANIGTQVWEDALLTARLFDIPDAQPYVHQLDRLAPGETRLVAHSVAIPTNLETSSIPISVDVTFPFKGTVVTTSDFKVVHVTAPLSAVVDKAVVHVKATGSYAFEFKLSNHTEADQQVMLQGSSTEGVSVLVPAVVMVSPKQTYTVTGSVYVGEWIGRGEYPVTIALQKEGQLLQTVSLVVNVDRNLLVNGSFELDANRDTIPDGWALRNARRTSEQAYAGSYSVVLVPNADDPNYQLNSTISTPAAPAGTVYRFSGWVKNDSRSGNVRFGIREMTDSDVTVRYTWIDVPPETDWAKYETHFTISPTTKKLRVYARMDQLAEGQVWFDDFYLDLKRY